MNAGLCPFSFVHTMWCMSHGHYANLLYVQCTTDYMDIPLTLKDWAILEAGQTGGAIILRSRQWIARLPQKFAQW